MSTSDKMKTTASDLLAKSKTGFARLKQQAMVKLGKAEETVDVPFAQEIQRHIQTHNLLKKINKDTQEMLELVKKLDVLQNTIAQDIYELYDSQSELYNAALKYQDVCKQFDQNRTQFETQMKSDFLDPLSKYIGQYKEVKERIKEEETRKVDMDRYGRELKSYQEKAKSAKASVYEQKYETAKLNYNNLRTELERDMPALYQDRTAFFNPAFATLITGISEYYRGCAKSISEVLPIVGHINRQIIHDHPRVITPPEQSSASHKASASSGSSSAPPTSPTVSYPQPANNASEARTLPVPPSKPSVQAPKAVRAQAMFDFNAQEANELGFKTGDVITILTQKGEWWEGELNGRRGLLPSNYVKLM